jgi:prostaglandin-endoperoxide synthase 2
MFTALLKQSTHADRLVPAAVIPGALSRWAPRLLEPLTSVPAVRRLASRLVINHYAYATSLRPRALTLSSDYTSWTSLTNRTFTGRHLPPADPHTMSALPPEHEVTALFRREGLVESTDTSVWFMFFAQWFTDSFLRTSRSDFRQNTSTQEIDLCQIYGLGPEQTRLLRSLEGGRLKSQLVDGEEFPVFLFNERQPGEPVTFKPEFHGLHDERFLIDTILGNAPDDRLDSVFAVGLEHGNSTIGNTLLNTLFLREHNRVARVLTTDHPRWDDERLFETTRMVMTVLLLKIVVEEYIRHIGPFDFAIEAVPFIADEERWNRQNWIAIEFNLLYRWHSLVPDEVGDGAERLSPGDFLNNNPLVVAEGIEGLIDRCSRGRAGRIGLRNTPAFLVDRGHPDHPSLEERSVALMRKARLRSFNDYRESYGLRRIRSFSDLTSDTGLRKRLEQLYDGDIDKLEWYVGIFAEDYPGYSMMGELLTTMVANDAFTQALTNPLLARNVFTEETFSSAGMRIITETHSLQQILERNSADPGAAHASFHC